jgi:hypothetical protein
MKQITSEQLENQASVLELINSEITISMARQADAGKQLDTKAVFLVGYAGAASSFLATRHAQPVLAAVAYVAYAACAVAGIWAYAVRLYQDVPAPSRLFNEYLLRSKAQTLAALAATRADVFESNARKHARKVRRWWTSLGSLAVGMTFMILALVGVHW